LNDELALVYSCDFKSYKLEIYNRWDERIFSTSNPDASWSARINDKALPSGIYFYLIKYTSNDPNDDEEHEIRGMVTVLK
jgi:gliding motility-associated-like protein